eukprot:5727533-Prymnesium_polylepis.1
MQLGEYAYNDTSSHVDDLLYASALDMEPSGRCSIAEPEGGDGASRPSAPANGPSMPDKPPLRKASSNLGIASSAMASTHSAGSGKGYRARKLAAI